MLKKKDGKDSDGASISVKSEQVGVVEVNKNPCNVLTAQSGRAK